MFRHERFAPDATEIIEVEAFNQTANWYESGPIAGRNRDFTDRVTIGAGEKSISVSPGQNPSHFAVTSINGEELGRNCALGDGVKVSVVEETSDHAPAKSYVTAGYNSGESPRKQGDSDLIGRASTLLLRAKFLNWRASNARNAGIPSRFDRQMDRNTG